MCVCKCVNKYVCVCVCMCVCTCVYAHVCVCVQYIIVTYGLVYYKIVMCTIPTILMHTTPQWQCTHNYFVNCHLQKATSVHSPPPPPPPPGLQWSDEEFKPVKIAFTANISCSISTIIDSLEKPQVGPADHQLLENPNDSVIYLKTSNLRSPEIGTQTTDLPVMLSPSI